jgi:hypothetical protein
VTRYALSERRQIAPISQNGGIDDMAKGKEKGKKDKKNNPKLTPKEKKERKKKKQEKRT